MRAYKFRTLNNFENIADIFCNNRFYAAHHLELNDPMEGMIRFEADVQQEDINLVNQFNENIRICSFSKSFDNLLLWAHYADGFKGICIELELNSSIVPLAEVSYLDSFVVGNDILKINKDLQIAALLVKNNAWRYEKEIRVITKQQFVCDPGVNIKSVLLGVRTPDSIKQILRQTLPSQIDVWETTICEKNNKVKKTQTIT